MGYSCTTQTLCTRDELEAVEVIFSFSGSKQLLRNPVTVGYLTYQFMYPLTSTLLAYVHRHLVKKEANPLK